MKMSMLYVLIFPLIILTLTAIFVLSPNVGLAASTNPARTDSPRSSTPSPPAQATTARPSPASTLQHWWYNVTLGWDMLIGRFLMMIPVLALAGNLASKKSVPPSPGTFPVNTALFTVLLVGVILMLGALTFFPALSLGPILEHLQLHAGQLF